MDVLQKGPRIFRNSRFGPSSRVSVDCGFYSPVREGLFYKTVKNASCGPSDRQATARIGVTVVL